MRLLHCVRALIMVLTIGSPLPSVAGPTDDAIAAFDRGDYATAIRIWRGLAGQGNATAQTSLGYVYEHGRGVAKDEAEAVRWYRKAADQGDATAQDNLGVMYRDGVGIAKDDVEAVKWFRKAAAQGNEWAQGNLGFMYEHGRGVAKDEAEAVRWYRKAADRGNVAAQTQLGVMSASGRGVAKDDGGATPSGYQAAEPAEEARVAYERGDFGTALRIWRSLAKMGFPAAQVRLGEMYENGQGVAADYAEAASWYRRAAEPGDPVAQSKLGRMYERGRGVFKDDAEAVKWYRWAAEQGNADGEANLRRMAAQGRGAEKGDATAVTTTPPIAAKGRGIVRLSGAYPAFPRAAVRAGVKRGSVLARLQIDEGGSVSAVTIVNADPPDHFDQAVINALKEWKFRAEGAQYVGEVRIDFALKDEPQRVATTGSAEVAKAAYDQGDYATALRIWSSLAEQGNAEAQTNLGVMYASGRGTAKDEAEAVRWYRKAAAQGDARAKTFLTSIEERQGRGVADLRSTIEALVRKYEAAQPVTLAPAAERAALAREIMEASRAREIFANVSDEFKDADDTPKRDSKISPKLLEAITFAAVASFRTDRILSSLERRLAEVTDSATLQVGLQWERSELGRRISSLDLEGARSDHRAERKDFAAEFIRKGGAAADTRGRACAQKGILDNSADSMQALFEAWSSGVAMAHGVQQGQFMGMDEIARAVVALRPLLRDAARQATLVNCLFDFRGLSDAEFDQWLEFLRTDSGGRYARGASAAARDTFLEISEVFTRTIVDVARQLKSGGES